MRKAKVWLWAADESGCGSYRMRFPSDAVTRHYGNAFEIRHGTLLSKGTRDWNPDVIVGQRVCQPGPSAAWQEWHRQGKVLITEMDDSLWDVPSSNLRGSAIFNSRDPRKRFEENLAVSDWVTVTTQALKDTVIRNSGFPADRIIVIPNAIPPELVVDTVPDPESWTHSLGYMASATHADDWKMVRRHVKRFLDNNPGTSFVSAGTDYGDSLGMPHQTIHRPWEPSPEKAIESIDYAVSIAPLLAGTFNRGKSDVKFLEASARGSLSIVSDVTAYGPVVNAKTGVKVAREHEWGRALQRLWDDPEEGYRLASEAHRDVRENRTTDNTAEAWADVYSRGKAR